MRKLAAALLAVPVLAIFYIPVLVRRSNAARIGLAIGVGGLVGLGALGLLRPQGTTATKPLPPIVPLSQAAVHLDDRRRPGARFHHRSRVQRPDGPAQRRCRAPGLAEDGRAPLLGSDRQSA